MNKFWAFTVNAQFGGLTTWANLLDQSRWMSLWSFFKSAVGNEISQNAISNAIKTLEFNMNKMNVSSFLDDLGKTNFWKAAGLNVNDSFEYEGFKGLMTAFAIVDAQTIIQVRTPFGFKNKRTTHKVLYKHFLILLLNAFSGYSINFQTFDANYDAILDSNESRDFFVFRGYEDYDGSMLITTDHNAVLKGGKN